MTYYEKQRMDAVSKGGGNYCMNLILDRIAEMDRETEEVETVTVKCDFCHKEQEHEKEACHEYRCPYCKEIFFDNDPR